MSYYQNNNYNRNQNQGQAQQQPTYGYQAPGQQAQPYGYTQNQQPVQSAWGQAAQTYPGYQQPVAPAAITQTYGQQPAAYGQPVNNTPYRAGASVAAAATSQYSTTSTKRSLVASVTKIHEKFCFIDNDIFCQLSLFRWGGSL